MSGSQTPNQLNSPLDSELGHLGGKGDPKQNSNWNREIPFKKLQRTDSERVRDTLPPEFKTADDQEALGNFMGGEGEELLTIVDEIRKIEALRNIELDIPQLVVVGGTSAGKSSILQALTRLPFPVATQLCTRFVTETTIRRCASSEKPGYRIEVKMDNSSHILAAPLEPMIFDDENWQTVELNLKQDIADVFEAMSVDNLPTTTVSKSNGSFKKHTEQTVTRMPQLLRHRVQITVRTKDQAFFSIVDIPGLISHGAPQDEKLSKELIVEYIKNKEAIILAVIPATNAPENEAVFRLIADNKASDRTIGVITKCDKIDGDPGKIFDLLRNRKGDDHLNLGWFAVRNRGPDEISGQANFEERDRKETELFGSGKWKEALLNPSLLKSIDSNVLGIKNLKHAIRKTMNKQVKENFPRLKAQMKDLKRENEKQLKRMGDPRTDPKEQRRYLSKVQALYENEVDKSLNGDYRAPKDHTHASHLRYHIKKFNDEYAKEMEYQGYKYMWRLEEDHTVPEIQDENKGAGPQTGIFEWIYQTWDYLIGSEVKGDIPQNLKKKLFDEQAESWEARARSYIEKVKVAIRDCNEDLFKEACKDDGLRWKIQELLEQLETKAFVAAEAEFDNILGDLGYIGSWHPMLDGDIELYQKKRATRQVQRDNPSDQPNQSRDSGQQTDSVEQLALSLTSFAAHNKRIYEIHDWLFAFWKVAFPRFVDNTIIQVVERHLLSQNGPLRLFNRDWVDDLSDEDLQRLAGEDEATTNERQSIKDKLQGLNDALEKTNHVMH